MYLEFIFQLSKIHRIGLTLPEPYGEQGRKMIRPFLEDAKSCDNSGIVHGIVGMCDNYRYDDAISHARPTMSSSLDRVRARERARTILLCSRASKVCCNVAFLGAVPFLV